MQTVCNTCEKLFTKAIGHQRFCSPACRWKNPESSERRKQNNLKRRSEQLNFIRNYKLEKGCSICGFKGHFAALQFDHLDLKEKSFNVSRGHLNSMNKIMEEISKCRVLCANCHSVHTFNQKEKIYAK